MDALSFHSGLQDKVALVTGGMGGIGQASVRALRAHGVRVAFTFAESQESTGQAQAFAASDPEGLSAHPLELRSLASIEACLHAALGRWGRLDVLVNNAAVGSATVASYAAGNAEQDSQMLTINADGTLKVCQTYLGLMQATQSTVLKIINIASVGGGVQAFPGFRLSDGMSKAAVAFLTRQLAAECVHSNIDVFAVCPGATNTKMFQQSTLEPMNAAERAAFVAALPKGRLIEPEEIAQIVVFLASQHSAPLHGAIIDASMGLGVRPGLISEHRF